jgi:photosystem II stability/assembly factor-like uncharacterized protein
MQFVKRLLIISLLLFSVILANIYHGSAIQMADQNRWKGWVVAIDTMLVLHTPNSGVSWINQSFQTSRYFFDVHFIDTLKGYIGTDQGFIYHTDDGGTNWVRQYMGMAKFITRFAFVDSNFGWAVCGGAIVGRTTNGGEQWDQLTLPYPPYAVDTVDMYDMTFLNPRKGWFCAGRFPEYIESLPGQGDTWYTKGQGYIAVSNDSGINWQLQRKDTVYDFFGIKFKDSLNGVVVGGNDRNNASVVMKSINGGQAWQTVTIPTTAKYLRALEWVGNHLWAVGRNGSIIHSSNNGSNWSAQNCPFDTTLFDVDFCDTLHGLIAGNGCVLYTNDGGNNWQTANIDNIEELNSNQIINPKLKIKAYPNPFRLQVTLQKPLDKNIYIYSVTGKLIRTYDTKTTSVIWNGKDNSGKFVPTGIYFVATKPFNKLTSITIIYQK